MCGDNSITVIASVNKGLFSMGLTAHLIWGEIRCVVDEPPFLPIKYFEVNHITKKKKRKASEGYRAAKII